MEKNRSSTLGEAARWLMLVRAVGGASPAGATACVANSKTCPKGKQVTHVLTALMAAAVLVGAVSAAQAAVTTGGCLAQKRKVWRNLRKCQGTEEAKQLQGKTADLAKCQTKFQDKLTKISDEAAAAAIGCRLRSGSAGRLVIDPSAICPLDRDPNNFAA